MMQGKGSSFLVILQEMTLKIIYQGLLFTSEPDTPLTIMSSGDSTSSRK